MADNITDTLTSIQTAFAEFKNTNDANLQKRDVVNEEKLTKLNDAIDTLEATVRDIEKKAQRPIIENTDADAIEELKTYLRAGAAGLETKASMSGSVDAEGGYTVPKLIDSKLTSSLIDISPVRSVATVVQINTPKYSRLYSTSGAASGWVSDKAARTETDAPVFKEVVPTVGEVYSNVYATSQLLADSTFDLEAFINNSIRVAHARAEGAAFISGDGTDKPTGILAGTPVVTADATRTFGTLQYVASGNAGALPTGLDKYLDIITSLKAGYRANANWMASKATIGEWRKVKDTTGQYMWQPSVQAGTAQTFFGYNVIEAEDVPAVAANSFSAIFGDFAEGYTVVDVLGSTILRDPYSAKPYITFYVTKRVGGKIGHSDALKLLKCSAT